MRNTAFIIALGLSSTAITQSNPPTDKSIPFQMVVNSGNRPSVKASINGFPVTLDVHSNAGFYMQISHKAADKGKIGNLVHVDTYGISSTGNVSSLGRDTAFVDKLTVGNVTFTNTPISIFETPSDYNHGMLGLRWITSNHAVVNFKNKTITINPTEQSSKARRKELRSAGYTAIPMQRSVKDGRYFITVTLNGITQPMIVSTVANNTLDVEFAKRAKIHLVSTGGTYGGPTGTTGEVFEISGPVDLKAGGISIALQQAQAEDIYAYAAQKRPTDESSQTAGMLAADFLVGNGAVVDFGNKTLFVKPKK